MTHVKPPRLIVIVTGANRQISIFANSNPNINTLNFSGIGYGTCCRFIDQLSYFNPPDSKYLPPSNTKQNIISPYAGATELTLVVACRNSQYGQETCESLSKFAKEVLRRRQKKPDHCEHAEKFYNNLQIQFLPLDLGSLDSVFHFVMEIQKRFPYISHLILNAGSSNIERIDWRLSRKQYFTDGIIRSVTYPTSSVQKKGFKTEDGLCYIWKVNVFGHFCLYRKLEPLLRANPIKDSRIEWTSSLRAFKHSFKFDDVQLLNTCQAYESSKFQINLLAASFAQSEDKEEVGHGGALLTHALIHPGICNTNNASSLEIPAIALKLKVLIFYLARLLGSVNHPISPFKGALAGTFSAFAPRKILRELMWNSPHLVGSRSTTWGSEYPGLDSWECDFDEAERLRLYCEDIYKNLPKPNVNVLVLA